MRGRPALSDAQKLNSEQIIDVALELLDEYGIAALNMRALADRLGVKAGALYWHLSDKSELMGHMSWRFYEGAIDAAAGSKTWEEWLRRFGTAFHEALLAHTDAAQLCAMARPRDQDPERTGNLLAASMISLGLSREEALIRLASVISLALGWAVYQQSAAQREYLERLLSVDTGLQTALDALLAGFSQTPPGAKRGAVARRKT